jgi:IclR family acetate operon transcriptional repressor
MNTVRAVERALSILFLVSTSTEPLGLTAISRETGIDKATALRLLFTLETFKLVRRDAETRRYLPGPGVWRLSSGWQRDLRTISHPHLEMLCRATQETPSLLCPRGLERVCVHAIQPPNELSVVPAVGSAQPIYFGASGKVMLAFLPDKERDKIIEITKLKSANPRAVTNRADFLKILRTVRRRGYATSSGDVTLGAAAVAAPVFNETGRLTAVVSLRGPEVRMPAKRMARVAPLVIGAADAISRELGYNVADRRRAVGE